MCVCMCVCVRVMVVAEDCQGGVCERERGREIGSSSDGWGWGVR